MRYSRTSLPPGNYAVLIHDRAELEPAINLLEYRIALATMDPRRFVWSSEPFAGGYRISANEFRG